MSKSKTDTILLKEINTRVIPLPKLSLKQKKKLLNTPIHRRIGLTENEYNNELKPHERDFVRRFTYMGFDIKWILRNKLSTTGIGYASTQLSKYNINNREKQIRRLYVLEREKLIEILLKK